MESSNPIIRNLRAIDRAFALAVSAILATALMQVPAALADEHAPIVRSHLVPTPDRAIIPLPASNGTTNELRRIELERGKSAVLQPAFSVRRVAVGDPEVADVVVLNPREIHVVAKTIGDTNVIVWNSAGRLEAAIDLHVGAPHSQIENELRRVLENDSIEVDGAGQAVVLKGTVASPVHMDRAVEVAQAFFGNKGEEGDDKSDRVINMLDIGSNQQVMIEIKMAEMSRTLSRRLGTNFSGITGNGSRTFGAQLLNFQDMGTLPRAIVSKAARGGISQVLTGGTIFGLLGNGADQLDFAIEAIQDRGLAKILAEPSLVARSGESAKFLAGGEIPIPVPQSGAFGVITIKFKEFGVGVTFTPTVMGPDRIHLNVQTEVSEPDFTRDALSVGGFDVPSFNTRRTSTGVELGDGQSFAISGLLRDDVSELIESIPGLGDLPILGALFRSTQFERKETELVMIVTPRLVQPIASGQAQAPTDNFVEPNAFEFFFLGALEGGVWDRQFNRSSSSDSASILPRDGDAAGSSLALETQDDPWVSDGLAGEIGHRLDISDVEGGL